MESTADDADWPAAKLEQAVFQSEGMTILVLMLGLRIILWW